MIYIFENDINSILGEQGYTIESLRKWVMSYIDDQESYYGISLALDDPNRRRQVVDSVNWFIENEIIPEISDNPDYEYDLSELIDEILRKDSSKSYFYDLNRSFDDLVDDQNWLDKKDREYDIRNSTW